MNGSMSKADLLNKIRRSVTLLRNKDGTPIFRPKFPSTDLRGVNLSGLDLRGTDLCHVDFHGANFRGSNLEFAALIDTDLRSADLRGANLNGTELKGAKLKGANLTDTILDPMNAPNAQCLEQFEKHVTRSGMVWCKGYRTLNSLYMDGPDYRIGEWYKAPWFSISLTSCHPGLYVRPFPEVDDVVVWFRDVDCHNAGNKWRVTDFFVEGFVCSTDAI